MNMNFYDFVLYEMPKLVCHSMTEHMTWMSHLCFSGKLIEVVMETQSDSNELVFLWNLSLRFTQTSGCCWVEVNRSWMGRLHGFHGTQRQDRFFSPNCEGEILRPRRPPSRSGKAEFIRDKARRRCDHFHRGINDGVSDGAVAWGFKSKVWWPWIQIKGNYFYSLCLKTES